MFKVVLERGCVERLAVVRNIFPNPVLEVADVVAALVPPNVMLFSLLLTVDGDLHTVIEQTIRLRVVEQVETNFGLFSRILYLEKEPLSMALRVNIVGHEQVVFGFRDFLCKVEVSALESGFKNERFIVFPSQFVHLWVENWLFRLVEPSIDGSRRY